MIRLFVEIFSFLDLIIFLRAFFLFSTVNFQYEAMVAENDREFSKQLTSRSMENLISKADHTLNLPQHIAPLE